MISAIVPANIRKVFDENLGITLVFNDEGDVVYLNEAAKKELGFEDGEVNIRDIFAVLFAENVSVQDFVSDTEGKVTTATAYRKNYTCFTAEIKTVRMTSEEDVNFNIMSILNTQYEVYARQEIERVENSMKESMRTRNEFVANITHELRTPVNGIKGHIKNLYSVETDIQKKRTMEIVLKCCDTMQNIISNFLDFSKIEAGKFEITEEAFNLRDCINQVVDTSIMLANEKGLKLTATVAEDIPDIVIGDELRITQVLNNLVSNALKFTSIGYVSIEVYKTRLKHGRMELTFLVMDTGIGVTPEQKEKMFKSFSQVDGSITRKYGGTGLGLYVTRQLVGLMHGDIRLDSEKGKGSVFSFNIEVGVEDADSNEEEILSLPQVMRNGQIKSRQMAALDTIYVYGSEENRKELRSNLEKLVLCIEMDNWERAELFADNVKQLTQEADEGIKKLVFKMQMSVRKENYDKSIEILEQINKSVQF